MSDESAGDLLSILGLYDIYTRKPIKVAIRPVNPSITGGWTFRSMPDGRSVEVMFKGKSTLGVRSKKIHCTAQIR